MENFEEIRRKDLQLNFIIACKPEPPGYPEIDSLTDIFLRFFSRFAEQQDAELLLAVASTKFKKKPENCLYSYFRI